MEVVHSGITGQAREESMPSQLCVCQHVCPDSSACFEPDSFLQSLVNRCCRRNHLRNTLKKKAKPVLEGAEFLVLKPDSRWSYRMHGPGTPGALGRRALLLLRCLFLRPALLCGLCARWVPAWHILEIPKRPSFSLAMMEWLGSRTTLLLKNNIPCIICLQFAFIF